MEPQERSASTAASRRNRAVLSVVVGCAVIGWALIYGLVRFDQLRFTRAYEARLTGAADRASASLDAALRQRSLELQATLSRASGVTPPTAEIARRVEALRSSGEYDRLVLMDAEGRQLVPTRTPARRTMRERAPFEAPLRRHGLFGDPGTAILNLSPNRARGAPELVGLGETRLLVGHYRTPDELFAALDSWVGAQTGDGALAYRVVDPSGDELYATAQVEGSWQPAGAPLGAFAGWRIETAPLAAGVEALAARRSRRALGVATVATGALALGVVGWMRRQAATASLAGVSVARTESPVRIGDCSVHLERFELERNGTAEPLSVREVELLQLLVANRGQVVRRETLLESVWGYGADIETRTLDTFVYRLRQKLESDPGDARHLVTVRGVGYKLTAG